MTKNRLVQIQSICRKQFQSGKKMVETVFDTTKHIEENEQNAANYFFLVFQHLPKQLSNFQSYSVSCLQPHPGDSVVSVSDS